MRGADLRNVTAGPRVHIRRHGDGGHERLDETFEATWNGQIVQEGAVRLVLAARRERSTKGLVAAVMR